MSTPTPDPDRRRLLQATLGAGLISQLPACTPGKPDTQAADVAQLDHTAIAGVVTPPSSAGVAAALLRWQGAACIAGGRYSMGGQTRAPAALQLDMRRMDRLLWLDPARLRARVQAGMRWRQLQALLDPLDLAIKVMQSYSNFSIGGSVSVNCHGRYVGSGALAGSVRALQLVTADGRTLELSRDQQPALFAAVIGGYGGLGVITEVELELARNEVIARNVEQVALTDYPAWFAANVAGHPDVVLHNADLIPPQFDAPLAISWSRSTAPLTDARRLMPTRTSYPKDQNLIWAASELPGGDQLRDVYQTRSLLHEPRVIMRNLEASLDAASLEPRTRRMSSYLLQEYFIPTAAFASFARSMAAILRRHDVNALNISVRHAPADTTSLMRWAREDVFCFVLYHKQRSWNAAEQYSRSWTRRLIDAALDHGGRYYLPYRLHASQAQFDRAYPQAEQFAALKQQWDPQNRFRNLLWDKYLRLPA
ncbi:FAD-binding oxidoreductase [Stenotrophomonas sp.]|uniref:FAD-binding oxidoreductase n=1 Tax=Stenotrophomonas sp. TaxID=69392 RepID=UPI0028AE33D9|nr:FAD-binding oxidoreductase [Stenotrophomonas sp.]